MLCRDIIGIFDLDKTTVKKDTREFLNKNENKGLVETVGYDIPLSFIVTGKKKCPQGKKQEKNKGVILSPISPATLGLRARGKKEAVRDGKDDIIGKRQIGITV